MDSFIPTVFTRKIRLILIAGSVEKLRIMNGFQRRVDFAKTMPGISGNRIGESNYDATPSN